MLHEFLANPNPDKWLALFVLAVTFGGAIVLPAFLLIREAFRHGGR